MPRIKIFPKFDDALGLYIDNLYMNNTYNKWPEKSWPFKEKLMRLELEDFFNMKIIGDWDYFEFDSEEDLTFFLIKISGWDGIVN